MMDSRGFTIVEMMLTVAISAILILALMEFIPGFLNLPSRLMARHETTTAARICMSTIVQALRQGKANSVIISPVGNDPNSSISFWTVNQSTYTIALSAPALPNTVTMIIQKGGATQTTTLAQNVSMLSFTQNYQDPSLVIVSLTISVPAGPTGQQAPVSLPSQTVQMISGATF